MQAIEQDGPLDRFLRGDERAFREIVDVYGGLVLNTALRMVRGDRHLAEDISQMVFADLVTRAEMIEEGTVLAGWLYRHTCFKAKAVLRAQSRRRERERKAAALQEFNAPEQRPVWDDIGAVMDAALNELGDADRDALALRFFQGMNYRGVGSALGTSADAARKRVDRAVGRLRLLLERRGVYCGSAALVTALAGGHSVKSATAGAGAGFAGLLGSAAILGKVAAVAAVAGLCLIFAGPQGEVPVLAAAGPVAEAASKPAAVTKAVPSEPSDVPSTEELMDEALDQLRTGEAGEARLVIAQLLDHKPLVTAGMLEEFAIETPECRGELRRVLPVCVVLDGCS